MQSYHSYISYQHYLPSSIQAHQELCQSDITFLPFLPTLPAVLNLCMAEKKCNLTLLTFLTNITKITHPLLFRLISNCLIHILPSYHSYQHYQLSLFFYGRKHAILFFLHFLPTLPTLPDSGS